ncbi:hypothetical protein BGX28_005831 [Mortierella sp. GBA30]|nr:hypothetical protein BGX28_005831 [Mortierella sp. GBA30]
MNSLPSRFLRITAPKNQLLRRLERLRTSKDARQEEGHVLVQGIKTLQELSSKGHRLRTIGITFDEHNLPIRSPALDIVASVAREDVSVAKQRQADDHRASSDLLEQHQRIPKQEKTGSQTYVADHYVAISRKLTTRILGTDSPTAEHEVFAEVAIPDYGHLFSSQEPSSKKTSPASPLLPASASAETEISRLLVLDKISDPGNMGLIIRSAKALFWDAAWHTPGTVDPYNNKVVRASRALCLDWPIKTGGWRELEQFLESRNFTLVVADMVPEWILDQIAEDTTIAGTASTSGTRLAFNRHNLVWWNWPSSLQRIHVPEKIALVMSSEHHGVASTSRTGGSVIEHDEQSSEAKARERLLSNAIHVSIPMNPAVESMNVAAATTAIIGRGALIHRYGSRLRTEGSSESRVRLEPAYGSSLSAGPMAAETK